MTPEEDSNQTNESSGNDAAGPVCGERLGETRHARGISVREIAKELHLDESKVLALEENRFDVLGAPVFAKGHLRKYAELVGVPLDDILADYYKLNRSVGAPPVVGPPRKISRDISTGPWVGGIVFVSVIAGAAWWWFNPEPASEPVLGPPETLAPFQSERQDLAVPDIDDGESSVEAEEATLAVQEPQADSSAEEIEESASDPEAEAVIVEETSDPGDDAAGSNVELVLSFAGDCWTEVTDATGRRLFFDLGSGGRTVTLSGVEPLGVLLGNSTNVSIMVNGYDYSIPAANRRGNTARLTIYGQ